MFLRKLVNRNFDCFRGVMQFNHPLDFIYNAWRKIFFATIWTYLCGHLLNCDKFFIIPLRVCDVFGNSWAMTHRTFIHNLFSPYFVISPFFWVWFIYCYNTYNWKKRYLNMQGLSLFSFAVYKTTRPIFIRGIIFNYFTACNGLFNFFRRNVPINSLFNAVFTISESFFNKCLTNLSNFHQFEYNIGRLACQTET